MPTGAGKTSALMALLGEMHCARGAAAARLPRARGVAYAPQEAWVLGDTVRANVLFGAPYDEERYRKGEIHVHRVGKFADPRRSALPVCAHS